MSRISLDCGKEYKTKEIRKNVCAPTKPEMEENETQKVLGGYSSLLGMDTNECPQNKSHPFSESAVEKV